MSHNHSILNENFKKKKDKFIDTIFEDYCNNNLDEESVILLLEKVIKDDDIEIRYTRNRKDVNNIYNTMTTKDKIFLAGEIGNPVAPKEYASAKEYGRKGSLLFHAILYKNNIPVAFADVFEHKGAEKTGEVCIGTRNGRQYRRKGYGTMVINEAVNWFKNQSKLKELRWYAHSGNDASISLAKKTGFKKFNDKGEYKGEFVEYDLRK